VQGPEFLRVPLLLVGFLLPGLVPDLDALRFLAGGVLVA
jgi:hypothetical protein